MELVRSMGFGLANLALGRQPHFSGAVANVRFALLVLAHTHTLLLPYTSSDAVFLGCRKCDAVERHHILLDFQKLSLRHVREKIHI